jgi:hypothetical protein
VRIVYTIKQMPGGIPAVDQTVERTVAKDSRKPVTSLKPGPKSCWSSALSIEERQDSYQAERNNGILLEQVTRHPR